MKKLRLQSNTTSIDFLFIIIVCLMFFLVPACSKNGGDTDTPVQPENQPEKKKVALFEEDLAKDVFYAAYAGSNPAIETDFEISGDNKIPNNLSEITTGFFRTFSKNVFKVEFSEKQLDELVTKGGFPFIAFIAGVPGFNKSVEIKGLSIGDNEGTADLKIDYLGQDKDIKGTTWKSYVFTMVIHIGKPGFKGVSDGVDYSITGNGANDITLVWNTSACLTLKLEGIPINTKYYKDNLNTLIRVLDFKCDNPLDFVNCEIYDQKIWKQKILTLISKLDYDFRFDSDSGEIRTSDSLFITFKGLNENPVNVKYNNWTITYSDCGTVNEEKQFNFWEMPQLNAISNANHMTNFYKLDGIFSVNDKSYKYDMIYGQVDDAVYGSMDKGYLCAIGFKGSISVPRLNNLNMMVDVESKYADDFEKIFFGTSIDDYYFDKFDRSIDMHFDNITSNRNGTGFNQGSVKLSYKKPGDSEALKTSIMINGNDSIRVDANPIIANWKKQLAVIK